MANIYCAPADMQDILSSSGVSLRSDDSPPTSYGGAAAKAGNKIDLYLYRFYTPENLALSDLVKDWAATLACYYLCQRRGNDVPASIASQYQTAIEEMTEIKNGTNDIPGIPRRKSYAPTISKMKPTMRPYPRAVVETSQGSKAGGESMNYFMHRDAWDRFGANAYLDSVL